MFNRVFRFDDISLNTDMSKASDMAKILHDQFHNVEIWFCLSALCCDIPKEGRQELIYPDKWNAMSDIRRFFKVTKCGIPQGMPKEVKVCSHGLLHVDHRLLQYETQEFSILGGSGLAQSYIFVPPFNKWNKDTEKICTEHDILLIKFEDGWENMRFNTFDPEHRKYYLHTTDFTLDQFRNWFATTPK